MAPLLLISSLLAAAPAPWAYATHSLVKVRPGTLAPHQAAIGLELGRNECQAAQLVVEDGAPVFALGARAAPLAGPHGSKLPVELYREADLEVQHASNQEGAVGPWPDILIPDVDPIAHEKRNAFPYDAPGDVPTVIYAQLCAPHDAAPGRYRGAITLTAKDHAPLQFPVVVEVLHYTLPATSSLPTAFGFSGISAAHAHGLNANDPEQVLAITQRYAKLALMDRISLFGMTMAPPPFKKTAHGLQVDFRDYDRELAPFMDGTALPSGARFTSLELRGPAGKVSEADRVAYYEATVGHLKARGWLDRLFLYAPDEPRPAQFAQVKDVARIAREADPRIRILLTASEQPGLAGVADLWTPNIVCMFPRPEGKMCPAMAGPDAYRADRKKGAKLWWYQSCMSHGCGPAEGPAARVFTGWPSYMVDASAVQNRAMGVAAYRYGIEGELYYSTTEAYDGDPWTDVWRFHGNGDGTLFYPGTPARIGGKTDVPLASLRLQQLRDGLQDYELLELADANGLHDLAQRAAVKLVPKPWELDPDPTDWLHAREQLAEALDKRLRAASEHASR